MLLVVSLVDSVQEDARYVPMHVRKKGVPVEDPLVESDKKEGRDVFVLYTKPM